MLNDPLKGEPVPAQIQYAAFLFNPDEDNNMLNSMELDKYISIRLNITRIYIIISQNSPFYTILDTLHPSLFLYIPEPPICYIAYNSAFLTAGRMQLLYTINNNLHLAYLYPY